MQTLEVFGLRFERGRWREWEHTCSFEEIEGVLDSAGAKAIDNGRPRQPTHADYLAASRYIFDVAYGPRENPAEGDTCVYGVRVDQMVFGDYRGLKEHFAHG